MDIPYDYLEVVIGRTTVDDSNTICEYNVGKDMFYKMLTSLKQSAISKDFKFFQNDYVETRHGNLQRMQYYQGKKLMETKMYDMKAVHMECKPDHVKVYYQRQKVPDVMFPSSLTYDNIRRLRRLIFRINNRLFLNFQIEMNEKKGTLYKVFLNFNNSRDADNMHIEKTIESILPLFIQPPESTC